MLEQLAPYLPHFPYDPTEVRFLGSPVDFVVFRGLSQNKVEEIIFVEVKSGNSDLTKRERSVRNAIRSAKVDWHLYELDIAQPDATRAGAVDVQVTPSESSYS